MPLGETKPVCYYTQRHLHLYMLSCCDSSSAGWVHSVSSQLKCGLLLVAVVSITVTGQLFSATCDSCMTVAASTGSVDLCKFVASSLHKMQTQSLSNIFFTEFLLLSHHQLLVNDVTHHSYSMLTTENHFFILIIRKVNSCHLPPCAYCMPSLVVEQGWIAKSTSGFWPDTVLFG